MGGGPYPFPYPFGLGTFSVASAFYKRTGWLMGTADTFLFLFALVINRPLLLATTGVGVVTGIIAGVIGPRIFSTLSDDLMHQGFSHQTARRNLVPELVGIGPAFGSIGFALAEMLIGNLPTYSAPLFFGTLSHLFVTAGIQGRRIASELDRLASEISCRISLTYSVGGPLFRIESAAMEQGPTGDEHQPSG